MAANDERPDDSIPSVERQAVSALAAAAEGGDAGRTAGAGGDAESAPRSAVRREDRRLVCVEYLW